MNRRDETIHHTYTTMTRSLATLARTLRPLRITRAPLRSYATLSPYTPAPTTPYEVFDEPSKARQRDRALIRLRSEQGGGDTGVVDYLREELAERLSERIEVSSRVLRWARVLSWRIDAVLRISKHHLDLYLICARILVS